MLEPEPAIAPVFRFHHPVEVRFRDLDPMGHAHHSLPLVYFEEARAAYWRQVAGRATVADIDYILAEATVRFHARITFPAKLEVAARVSRLGEKSFTMEYQLRDAAHRLLASGRTVQILYDYAQATSKPIPPEVRQRIEGFEGSQPPT
ncbi:MAG: acyl-CoA thioesterase [Gemmatimonadetes bacterium]|nr:acyl-CoA thioesterase [Gemmatimonadota bacterium]